MSFFSIAVGLLALANGWRVAVRIWGAPREVAVLFTYVSLAVWAVLVVAYAYKWLTRPDMARAELEHPVQSSFAALLSVSSLLAAVGLLGFSRTASVVVFGLAVVIQLPLGVYLHGRIWQGGHKDAMFTPVLYLPTVAQNLVAATAASVLGWRGVAALFFGAGVLSWLAVESLILHRAATQDPMPKALRPAIGIQLAPPVVCAIAYLNLQQIGWPDLIAQILLGYGLYQALLLLRLLPWVRKQPFSPAYWAFSFGVAALPTTAMLMVERGADGIVAWLAPVLFGLANLIIITLAVKTLQMLVQGTLIPHSVPVAKNEVPVE